jgi:hypothetical protein
MEFLTPSERAQIRQKLMAKLFIGGIRSGVNGTPGFGERHNGAYDYASLLAGIRMRSAADAIP